MSRLCDHIALTPDEEAALCQAAEEGDEALAEWWDGMIDNEEKKRKPFILTEDRAWEPIHRCLTEDHQAWWHFDAESGDPPLSFAIMGGEALHEEWDRTFWLVTADEVAELVSALHEIDEGWFRKRFFSLPDNQFHQLTEEELGWVWDCFRDVRAFYQNAAAHGLAAVCTISH